MFRCYLQVTYVDRELPHFPQIWQMDVVRESGTSTMLEKRLFDERDRVSLKGCSRRCGKTSGALQIRVCLSPSWGLERG
jgi:hypothetical protein